MPTVLIVDDDPIVRNVVRLALWKEGFAVMDANGAGEAAALCERLGDQVVDLLIIDHRIPPGKGRDVAEIVLKFCPAVKVMIVSGWAYKDVEDEDGFIPGSSFLAKPFSPEQLLSAVKNVLFPKTQ